MLINDLMVYPQSEININKVILDDVVCVFVIVSLVTFIYETSSLYLSSTLKSNPISSRLNKSLQFFILNDILEYFLYIVIYLLIL